MMFREPENKGIDFKLFGYMMDMEEKHPFHNFADIYVSALGEGLAEAEVPVTNDHLNMYGFVHGGVYAALADGSMGLAATTLNKAAVTTTINMNYLQKATKGDVLRAVATVTRNGKKVIYTECRIYNQREELLATAQGTFYVVHDNFVEQYIEKLRAEGNY